MNIRILACSLFLFFVSCSHAVKNKEKANELEIQGKYQEAILYLNKAIEEDSLFIDAYLDRAVDRSILGDYRGAIQDYSKVIQIDNKNALAYYNRARNYYKVENMSLALKDINQAYKLETKNSHRIDSLNVNLHIQDIYNDKYSVPVFEIIFERGLIYYEMDSLEKAYVDIDNCIIDEELSAQAYYWRGVINLKLGYKSEACDDLNNAYLLGVIEALEVRNKHCN